MAQLPPPGWYKDPRYGSGEAYWNGRAWAAPRRMSNLKVLMIIGGTIGGCFLLLAACIGAATMGGSHDRPTRTAADPAAPTSSTPPPGASMKSGTWYKIDDCLLCDGRRPGVYESRGAVDDAAMTPCSWRRNTQPSGDLSYVIALGKVDAGQGVGRVTLNSGEYFFSQGCYEWNHVG